MIYAAALAAVWWRKKKCSTLGVAPPKGGRWSKTERGNIANKGDIVCNVDDSQVAEEPLSRCDKSSLIPSPAPFFSDLLHSPFSPICSLNGGVTQFSFFSDRLVLICLWALFLSLIPVWVIPLLTPLLLSFLYKVEESQTFGCHLIFHSNMHPFTLIKAKTFPQTPSHTGWE